MTAFRFTSFSLLSLASTHASAAPMALEEKNVTGLFSAKTKNAFNLLADSEDNSLVYYVPNRGGLAVDSPMSTNPIPRFAISSFSPSFGFFGGETLVRLGGSFSTTSDLGNLGTLEEEAKALGLRVAPAPAATATTKFLLGAYELADGRLDISCTKEELKVTRPDGTEKINFVPKCNTKSDPSGPTYDLDLNVMYKFASLPATSNSVVSQTIPFQAVTLPNQELNLRAKMQSGASWDDYITAKVDWEITAQRKTRQARFHINWQSTFEQASAFAAYHDYSCVDVELKGFYQKLTSCSKEDECGIRVEYMQTDGSWADKAPDNAAFINASNEVQKRLNDELFTEVQNKSTSHLGRVSEESKSQFTLRANYEKIMFSKNEVIPFAFNEGQVPVKSSTILNISCLKGGFEEGRVTWNMEDTGCKSQIGQ